MHGHFYEHGRNRSNKTMLRNCAFSTFCIRMLNSWPNSVSCMQTNDPAIHQYRVTGPEATIHIVTCYSILPAQSLKRIKSWSLQQQSCVNSVLQVQNAIFCVNMRSAMFCMHLSQNWYAVRLLPGWDIFCSTHGQPVAHSHSFEDYQIWCSKTSTTIRKCYIGVLLTIAKLKCS